MDDVCHCPHWYRTRYAHLSSSRVLHEAQMLRRKLTDATGRDATKRDLVLATAGCACMGGTLLARRILMIG